MTFEGQEYLSQTDSISSPILSSDLEQICLNIVKHIQEVSGGNIQISRMNLFFKIDDKNRIWLLFCSGIKVREKFLSKEEKSSLGIKKNERITSPVFCYASRKIDKDQMMRSKTNPMLGKKFCANCESHLFTLKSRRERNV